MAEDETDPLLPNERELSIDEAMRVAIGLHQRGFVEDAVQVYQAVLGAHPDHVDALHFFGMAAHQSGQSTHGIELIRRVTELAPNHADAHNNLGNILSQLGKLEEAALAYTRSLSLRPDDPNANNNLGTVRKRQGKLEAAERLFRRVIELAPEHAEAHHNLGNVLSRLDRFDEALDVYQRALALREYDGPSHRRLGAALYAVGRVAEATEIYHKWCALAPDDPEAQHMLAACLGNDVPARTPDHVVAKQFDRFAASFDHVLQRLGYRAPELIAQAIERALGPAPAEAPLSALDAGCGTGLCGAWLRRYARKLVGVDLSQAMLGRAAERKLYDELSKEELTAHLRAHAAQYDLIVSADTLVYFGDLGEVSHAARAALRAGGHLAFTVERSLAEEAPKGYRIHPHGRYSHTDAYLRSVLAAADLSLVSLEHAHLRTEFSKPVDGWVVVATPLTP